MIRAVSSRSIDERCGTGISAGVLATVQICARACVYVCVRRVGDGNGTRAGSEKEKERERERERCSGLMLVGVVPDLTEGGSFYILWWPTPRSGMLLAGYTHWR